MKDSRRGPEGVSRENVSKVDLNDDIDALFKLSLAEFTGSRNALATQLKKSGRGDEAAFVKALAKPSVSAWAVNQLYWNHRDAFNRLIALGERFHRAQKSGKVADMREVLDARREALSQLSDVAASVLQSAGHSPAPDTIHRITTTLEGMSVYGSRSDGPQPGRLTQDVDPPGFESFGSFVPRMRLVPPAVAAASPSSKRKHPTEDGADRPTTKTRRKATTHDEVRQVEETRKAKIAAAKASLQDARRSLTEIRARAKGLQAAQIKADADAKKTEKLRRDVEEELRKAKAASEQAAKLARGAATELEDATRAVDDAEGTVEKASKELESLTRESSGR